MKRIVFAVVLLAATLPVMGQVNIGLNGVGAQVGFVMPEDPIDNTIGFGANVDLGTLMPNLHLTGSLDYWKKSYDDNWGSGYGAYDMEVSFSVISVAALAKYYFDMGQQFTPYAGGGLGLLFATSKVEVKSSVPGVSGDESDTETELGVHLLGGASMPITPELDGFAELRYTLGDIDYFTILAGVTYALKR